MYRALATLRVVRAPLRRAPALAQRRVLNNQFSKRWNSNGGKNDKSVLGDESTDVGQNNILESRKNGVTLNSASGDSASTTPLEGAVAEVVDALTTSQKDKTIDEDADIEASRSTEDEWSRQHSAAADTSASSTTSGASALSFGSLDIYTNSPLSGYTTHDSSAPSTTSDTPTYAFGTLDLYTNSALSGYTGGDSSDQTPKEEPWPVSSFPSDDEWVELKKLAIAAENEPEVQYAPARSMAPGYPVDERDEAVSREWIATQRQKAKELQEAQHAHTKSLETEVARNKRGFEWEENPHYDVKNYWESNVKTYDDLPAPYERFGHNQQMVVDPEFKEALKGILNEFPTIRYAFAYGSGVFPQSKRTGKSPTDAELRAIHPNAPAAVKRTQDGTPKMIDFIFGVPLSSHWHSLNLKRNRHHYSGLGMLGSDAVTFVQDRWGAGVYYNPYVIVNGVLIKYGVVNIDTLTKDLYEWNTLYLAGRLHKPVKILRDHPQIRLANQVNILAAMRVALLLLPEEFTERELYATIAGLSYLGDPRMALPTENPKKIDNIVGNNIPSFRRLYSPLIDNMPNISWDKPNTDTDDWFLDLDLNIKMRQDLDPVRRGNMVRRLPKAFRSRLYFQYQKKFAIPRGEFNRMMEEYQNEDGELKRREGGGFEQRIAKEDIDELRKFVRESIKQTISWPSTTQSIKGVLTAGIPRSWRYLGEKMGKWKEGKGGGKA